MNVTLRFSKEDKLLHKLGKSKDGGSIDWMSRLCKDIVWVRVLEES